MPLVETRRTLELVAAIYASAAADGPVRAGEIVPGHRFYDRMDGHGALRLDTAAAGARP